MARALLILSNQRREQPKAVFKRENAELDAYLATFEDDASMSHVDDDVSNVPPTLHTFDATAKSGSKRVRVEDNSQNDAQQKDQDHPEDDLEDAGQLPPAYKKCKCAENQDNEVEDGPQPQLAYYLEVMRLIENLQEERREEEEDEGEEEGDDMEFDSDDDSDDDDVGLPVALLHSRYMYYGTRCL